MRNETSEERLAVSGQQNRFPLFHVKQFFILNPEFPTPNSSLFTLHS